MLIGSLAFDALLALAGASVGPLFTGLRLDFIASVAVLGLAFAVLLTVLPDIMVRWRDAVGRLCRSRDVDRR